MTSKCKRMMVLIKMIIKVLLLSCNIKPTKKQKIQKLKTTTTTTTTTTE